MTKMSAMMFETQETLNLDRLNTAPPSPPPAIVPTPTVDSNIISMITATIMQAIQAAGPSSFATQQAVPHPSPPASSNRRRRRGTRRLDSTETNKVNSQEEKNAHGH